MKNKLLLTVSFIILSCLVFAQTYITNVTLADVEKQKLVPNQTVIFSNGLITKIQSSKIKIPVGAAVIDATGKYLFPGLTDAHIHFFQNGGLYARPDAIDLRKQFAYSKEIELAHETMEDKLKRYLRSGITTVFDVGSTISFLKQKEQFKNTSYAPTVYMTGPLLTTYEPKAFENLKNDEPFSLVKTIDDGIKMVNQQLTSKPDFIKIWYIAGADGLGVEASARKNLPRVKAIIEEAHKNNLKVAVHATERITAQLAVENGCDFLVHSIEDEIIKDDFVQLLKKNKTILCPTLTVGDGYQNTFAQNLSFSNYELTHADPFQLGSLMDLEHIADTTLVKGYKKYATAEKQIANAQKTHDICTQNLKILSDAGVLIATGTDAGNIGTLHASSYLKELQAMQKSGMSNWKIIQASTINAAKILQKENETGSIALGKKADMILLNSNPIDSLEGLIKIFRVIKNGVIIDPDTLIKETPTSLAQRQLNAYNKKNIEAFLEPYADDVEIYNYPDKLMLKGKEMMRKDYVDFFKNTPNLHCELLGRIVQGNVVIDKERVRFGQSIMEAVAIYHIENNKIKKVYFVK